MVQHGVNHAAAVLVPRVGAPAPGPGGGAAHPPPISARPGRRAPRAPVGVDRSTASNSTRSWWLSCTKSESGGVRPKSPQTRTSAASVVLRTLHVRDVAVRRGGPPSRAPSSSMIDPRRTLSLCRSGDQRDAAAAPHPPPSAAREHHRSLPGSCPVTESFLREAYMEIGLAATHIEQMHARIGTAVEVQTGRILTVRVPRWVRSRPAVGLSALRCFVSGCDRVRRCLHPGRRSG